MTINKMMLFSGNANRHIAEKVAAHLQIDLGDAIISQFSDGETMVNIRENVRGRNVYLLQSTCPPANQHLMELLVIADALKRASAKTLTAVIPYFGYARQDRRVHSARVPITAKLVADLLTVAGFTRMVTIDLHAEQIQGFFSIPVDNIYTTPLFLGDLRHKVKQQSVVIVSPDVGGTMRARAMAKQLGDTDLAIIDKRRPEPNVAEVLHIIGDVAGRHCVIVDDMIDTAGTLVHAAEALVDAGALSVCGYATHAVLSGPAISRVNESVLRELVVSNTIPLTDEAERCSKIRVLDVSPILAEALRRIDEAGSLRLLFSDTHLS